MDFRLPHHALQLAMLQTVLSINIMWVVSICTNFAQRLAAKKAEISDRSQELKEKQVNVKQVMLLKTMHALLH